ncbi:hypothetical protein DRX78_22635, partial [Salmonella enterica subsp. enterica serovar Oakland]|nr:hypothetical protein [Salmonella enterica subsp. enterica serovar Oakland]EBY7882472.1 hypothetical protein [Salmonella enterica subsp. enterica serovar Oakland]
KYGINFRGSSLLDGDKPAGSRFERPKDGLEEASLRMRRVIEKAKAFERCEATARRVNHEVIHKLPGIKLQ